MLFVIIGYDGPEGEAKRKIHRPAHLANLKPLDEQERVILAGPLTDKAGSLLVLDFETQEEAERFAHTDPYTVQGIFERVEVHPFMQVLPKPR
ncbi:MAG: YciI family protein [Nitrospiraceae bacterium]|jgi:uncharacterized protein YciI|uniref:YciI family protein n=1 Tax=Nitrospira cf. moscoviensis SBR1015 TaxID=96242 RepID=UPI000A0E4408|nr:YciI family protein [Nitrospira cf. moscoviensis SBR1015]MBY0247209.1 YciI family protein [Nitrospiraceae bacterium]OQW36743.1 MAG: hypothetical protein A4E20_06580 [Nitrospira sp. SG-bin2]